MEEGRIVSGSQAAGAQQQAEQDDELTIPRAAMNKMIKELLPNIRVANEARELVLNCCTEFIHLISSESNDICNQQQKKTISAEHVLAALEKLGYGDFRKDAEEVTILYYHLCIFNIVSFLQGLNRVQGNSSEETKAEHSSGKPWHPRGGITQAAARALCQV